MERDLSHSMKSSQSPYFDTFLRIPNKRWQSSLIQRTNCKALINVNAEKKITFQHSNRKDQTDVNVKKCDFLLRFCVVHLIQSNIYIAQRTMYSMQCACHSCYCCSDRPPLLLLLEFCYCFSWFRAEHMQIILNNFAWKLKIVFRHSDTIVVGWRFHLRSIRLMAEWIVHLLAYFIQMFGLRLWTLPHILYALFVSRMLRTLANWRMQFPQNRFAIDLK